MSFQFLALRRVRIGCQTRYLLPGNGFDVVWQIFKLALDILSQLGCDTPLEISCSVQESFGRVKDPRYFVLMGLSIGLMGQYRVP